jgi:eukaryotic-like serine/threonine-protein kinase
MAAADVIQRRSPERIGRYEVIERIGRGAMGVVYRARDEAMGRDVALKVLMADLEDDPDVRARFLREAEAAASLSHPNIITIFDVGEDNDRFFIVMELLRGATLKDFLKQPEGAPLDRKIDLMMQMCGGLGAAHKASVFHRDMKPGNIFVRADGILKILDFGVARLASSSMTASGFIVGTPDYMSPEQVRGAEVDARSDIFSLGGVFYYMLAGRKPFPANDLPTLFRQIQTDDAPPFVNVDAPPELINVIRKALAKSPDARYQSCRDVAADLELVKHLYSVREKRVNVGTAAVAAVAAGVGASGCSPLAAVPALEAGSSEVSTEDTVDLTPAGAVSTEDTVSLSPPTWIERVSDRIDTAISGARARLGRSSSPVPTRQTGLRKR